MVDLQMGHPPNPMAKSHALEEHPLVGGTNHGGTSSAARISRFALSSAQHLTRDDCTGEKPPNSLLRTEVRQKN